MHHCTYDLRERCTYDAYTVSILLSDHLSKELMSSFFSDAPSRLFGMQKMDFPTNFLLCSRWTGSTMCNSIWQYIKVWVANGLHFGLSRFKMAGYPELKIKFWTYHLSHLILAVAKPPVHHKRGRSYLHGYVQCCK